MTANELSYVVPCKACRKPALVKPVEYGHGSVNHEYHDRAKCAHCGAEWDACCDGPVSRGGVAVPQPVMVAERMVRA